MPAPLPPKPPLELRPEDYDLFEQANRALGRLDGLATVLPDTSLLVYMYVRKEALLSSQIEGTQSSFSDLLAHELEEVPGVPFDEVIEVSSYVAAMEHGLRRLREGLPLSLRLLREIHGVLLAKGRGSERDPGEFRRSQNWIGGSRPGTARYVPPPPDRLSACLDAFEKFLHDQPQRTPLLTLLLCAEGALSEPILYLSLHFKAHRDEYYERLQRVRTDGEWEDWVRFFLDGVLATSRSSVEAARRILALFDTHRKQIQRLGRPAGSALLVHLALQRRPLLTIARAVSLTGLSQPTISSSLHRMFELGVVREVTGRRRDRLFVYGPYLDLLSEGTEPLR
jgi:Fic family protein